MNSMMPDFSKDCTRAATSLDTRAPYNFIPHMESNQIDEIIKGCYCA